MGRVICPTCTGTAMVFSVKKAREKRNPKIKQAIVRYPCKKCKGTGWLDPKK